MKIFFEVFLISGRGDFWQTDTPCGYFSSRAKAKKAIREVIKSSTEDQLTKGDFDVYEHILDNPDIEFHPQGLLVQDLWGTQVVENTKNA